MANFCQLLLTCKDADEADKISKVLLEKKLIACVKQLPVSSAFRWQKEVESAQEILLVMDSREDLFDEVEAEITKLHSYDTFVLQSIAVTKVSKKAKAWLNESLRNG